MKLDNNRKQAAQKKSIKYPDHLKQVENNKKWKEFTNLKAGTYMTYKSRQYGEKDGHKLMKAILYYKRLKCVVVHRRHRRCVSTVNSTYVAIPAIRPSFRIPPFRNSITIPPFRHSITIPPFRHSAIPPFRHSAIPREKPD